MRSRLGLSMEDEDAAKRVANEYSMHRNADPIGSIGRWFAIALQDGSSDHDLYPSRAECVRHQKGDVNRYGYIQCIPSMMSLKDAWIFLNTNRKLYDKGVRMTDPDMRGGGMSVIPRVSREDQAAQVRSILHGTRPTNRMDVN